MSASKIIKQIMIERDISVKTLSKMMGVKPQILSNKLYRDTFTYNDYIKIVNLLGCTVQTVISDTKKTFINSYVPREVKLKRKDSNNDSNKDSNNNSNNINYIISKEAIPTIPVINKKDKEQEIFFTEEDIKKFDLHKLLVNISYQMEIAETFGMDILAVLLDKARQQEAENKTGS